MGATSEKRRDEQNTTHTAPTGNTRARTHERREGDESTDSENRSERTAKTREWESTAKTTPRFITTPRQTTKATKAGDELEQARDLSAPRQWRSVRAFVQSFVFLVLSFCECGGGAVQHSARGRKARGA